MAERFVVDASVVAKWFLKDDLEDQVDLAEEVLLDGLAGETELYAPRIMSYEVSRLLWKACITQGADKKTKRLAEKTALSCVELIFELPLTMGEATLEEATSSISHAVRFRKNFYDMTYLTIALEIKGRVVTADKKLLLSAPEDFPLDRFVLLDDYRNARNTQSSP